MPGKQRTSVFKPFLNRCKSIEEIKCLCFSIANYDENGPVEWASYVNNIPNKREFIAELLGKSQSFVANKIRLLKLDPSIIETLTENNLTERHARALLRIPDTELQEEVLKQVVKKDMTVKKTEELVEKIRKDVLTNNYDEKLTPEKKARVKSFINAQIYINTIKTAFKAVKESRNTAEYKEIEREDYVEIKIIIPK